MTMGSKFNESSSNEEEKNKSKESENILDTPKDDKVILKNKIKFSTSQKVISVILLILFVIPGIIAILYFKFHNYKNYIKDQKDQLDSLNAIIAEQENIIENITKEKNDLTVTISQNEVLILQLEKKIKDLENTNELLQKHLNLQTKEFNTNKAMNESLRESNNDNNKFSELFSNTLGGNRKKRDEDLKKIRVHSLGQRSEEEISKFQTKIENNNRRMTELIESNTILKSTNENLKTEYEKTKIELEKLKSELENLKTMQDISKIDNLKEQHTKLCEEMKTKTNAIESLKDTIKSKDKTKNELQKELEKLKAESAKMENLKTKYKNLKKEFVKHKQMVENIKTLSGNYITQTTKEDLHTEPVSTSIDLSSEKQPHKKGSFLLKLSNQFKRKSTHAHEKKQPDHKEKGKLSKNIDYITDSNKQTPPSQNELASNPLFQERYKTSTTSTTFSPSRLQ